LIQR